MRIIVTGGAGFIGSRLAERLVERGDDVTIIDIEPVDVEGCRSVQASVLDPDAMLREIRGVDVVAHLAGFVRGGMRKQPYEGARLQLDGNLNVLEAARRNDVPHVAYASSFYVYDGIPSTQRVNEDTPLNPLGMELFGSAKLMGEVLCLEYSKNHGLPFTAFRLGPVFGPGGSSAVGTFIETGLKGEVIDVWGRGQRKNQYTYLDDVVEGMIAGLTRRDRTYNLVAPEAPSTGDLAGMLKEEYGFETVFEEDKPEGPSFPYIESDRAMAELGWRPTSLAEGLRRTHRSLVEELRLSPSSEH